MKVKVIKYVKVESKVKIKIKFVDSSSKCTEIGTYNF